MKWVIAALATVSAAVMAPSANAAQTIETRACLNTDISPNATDCEGWFRGNLISGNADDLAASALAVNALLGTSFTGATLPVLETLENLSGDQINFTRNLVGPTVIGIHVGAANGANGIGYNGTGFFLLNPDSLDTVGLNIGGLSNARLFVTSPSVVPEPATWAMLLIGFGVVGTVMRRKKSAVTRVRFA